MNVLLAKLPFLRPQQETCWAHLRDSKFSRCSRTSSSTLTNVQSPMGAGPERVRNTIGHPLLRELLQGSTPEAGCHIGASDHISAVIILRRTSVCGGQKWVGFVPAASLEGVAAGLHTRQHGAATSHDAPLVQGGEGGPGRLRVFI